MLELIRKFFRKLVKLFRLSEESVETLYIANGEALPSPLSSEEEQQALTSFMAGDEEARKKLIEHNLRLVVYIAKRFENTGMELEDLISVGAIGLIKAIKTYNFEKKIKLATYASRCIENEILMQLRKTSKQKIEVSLDEPLNYDSEGNELLLADILSSDDNVSKNLEQDAEKQILWASLSRLCPREQEIMKLRFGLSGGDEKTQKEVADLLGISQSYISRIEKKILSKIKTEIQKVSNL